MERCRAVAHTLDVRRVALTERYQPVVELHNNAVWQGVAATASRERLRRITGLSLHFLDLDIAATSRALLDEASMLAQEAAVLRRRARGAEDAASAARRLARDIENDRQL